MPDDTKICEACDAVIGKSETTCPKCGVVFADLDEAVATVERANVVLEKRKKASQPPTPAVQPPAKKESVFSRFGKAVVNASKNK